MLGILIHVSAQTPDMTANGSMLVAQDIKMKLKIKNCLSLCFYNPKVSGPSVSLLVQTLENSHPAEGPFEVILQLYIQKGTTSIFLILMIKYIDNIV